MKLTITGYRRIELTDGVHKTSQWQPFDVEVSQHEHVDENVEGADYVQVGDGENFVFYLPKKEFARISDVLD